MGGGFIGPLGVGFVLGLWGGNSVTSWGLAFGHIAVITRWASSSCANSAALKGDKVL